MKEIVIDIETIPAPAELESAVRTVFERRAASRIGSFSDFHRNTALSGNWGQILCIGIAVNNQPVNVINGSEATILSNFWEAAKDADRIIGHHIVGFDIPFILKRSVVNNILPTVDFRPLHAPKERIFDTKLEWDQGDGHTGLDQLAKILRLPSSKQEMDGSMVYDYYLAKKLDAIYEYCRRDVELTRAIYHKLTHQNTPGAL